MTTAGSALARELQVVDRARAGDHAAFVELYRQDAPPAWRLALALTADPDLAADAVAFAFARVLAPPKPGAARSEVPFRLRLLTATRHAVLDLGSGAPRVVEDDRSRSGRAVEVMHAFHQLPERWRTVLWLLVVEGLGTAEAAGILGVAPDGAIELAERASAGLRTRWQRDRVAAGHDAPVAPELEHLLQTVLPLPLELFDAVERRWEQQRERKVGAVGLVLPGGRAVPSWAERGLLAGTAALIAAGITSALVVDRDPDVRRARGELAEGPRTTLGPSPSPKEPQAYLDGEDDGGPGGIEPALVAMQAAASSRATADRVVSAAAGGATIAPPSTTTDATDPPTSTTVEPGLEITAGVGPALALSLGDQCTGLSLGGQVIGCPPEPDEGVHFEGSLLPGG